MDILDHSLLLDFYNGLVTLDLPKCLAAYSLGTYNSQFVFPPLNGKKGEKGLGLNMFILFCLKKKIVLIL